MSTRLRDFLPLCGLWSTSAYSNPHCAWVRIAIMHTQRLCLTDLSHAWLAKKYRIFKHELLRCWEADARHMCAKNRIADRFLGDDKISQMMRCNYQEKKQHPHTWYDVFANTSTSCVITHWKANLGGTQKLQSTHLVHSKDYIRRYTHGGRD